MWIWAWAISEAEVCIDTASKPPSAEREHHRASAAQSWVAQSSVSHQEVEFLSTRQKLSQQSFLRCLDCELPVLIVFGHLYLRFSLSKRFARN